MGNTPEQLNIDFESSKNRPEIHEKDECSRCGNSYDSPGSCVECMERPEKEKYKETKKNSDLEKARRLAEKSVDASDPKRADPNRGASISALTEFYYQDIQAKKRKKDEVANAKKKK